MFDVNVRLTPEGLANYEDVVRLCFQVRKLRRLSPMLSPRLPPSDPRRVQAVAALHAQSDAVWVEQHAEIAQVASNGVRFRAKSEPTTAVLGAVGAMRDYPTEHCLVGSSLMGPLDLVAIRAALGLLNPHNMLLAITAKPSHADWQPFPGDAKSATLVEPHYGFSFTVAQLTATQLAAWGARPDMPQVEQGWRSYTPDLPLSASLAVPLRNDYIPSDFVLRNPSLAAPDVVAADASTSLVLNPHPLDFAPASEGSPALEFLPSFPEPRRPAAADRLQELDVWYKPDVKFGLPKSTVYLRLTPPRAWQFTDDPHRRMLVTVLLSIVDDMIQVCLGCYALSGIAIRAVNVTLPRRSRRTRQSLPGCDTACQPTYRVAPSLRPSRAFRISCHNL